MKNHVYLGLGSNMGDRKKYLENAIGAIEDHPDLTVIAESSIYETEPFGDVEQNSFLNMVIKIATSLMPDVLLNTILEIEKSLDRIRTIRWGPRTIDIDILFYGNEEVNTDDLVIPHPGITDRAFVLVPLLELAPDIKLPSGEDLKDFLELVPDDVDSIKLYKKI